MTELENITKLLKDAESEKIDVDKEYARLEFHRKHLTNVITDLRAKVLNLTKGTLAPVEVTVIKYSKDEKICDRQCHTFNTLEELTAKFDFECTDDTNISIDCFHDFDNFSVRFSIDYSKLSKVIAKGKVRFVVYSDWKDYNSYVSEEVESPTYFQALQYFHQSIYTTNDKYHIFLEAVEKVTEGSNSTLAIREKVGNDVQLYYFVSGS